MRPSAPSDTPVLDATFLVGNDLVEFDRRELPIYAAPRSRWMDACHDEAPAYGAPVDRLFGEPGEVHIDAAFRPDAEAVADALLVSDDPLVALATLADGLGLAAADAPAPELATSFDFGAESGPVIVTHDATGWDMVGSDGTFDYLA
jgi:hypothetical protein